MRKIATICVVGLMAAVTVPAVAQDGAKAEVVERDAKGKATKVKVGDKVYDVCTMEKQDSCINPRAAGLNFGNVPLDRWPGHPASQPDPQ